MNSAPYSYGSIVLETAPVTPSTIHVTNTALSAFFRRYLLSDLLSVWEWKIPENWDSNYFKAVLFSWGYFAIIDIFNCTYIVSWFCSRLIVWLQIPS